LFLAAPGGAALAGCDERLHAPRPAGAASIEGTKAFLEKMKLGPRLLTPRMGIDARPD
jgi:hypothetical protein